MKIRDAMFLEMQCAEQNFPDLRSALKPHLEKARKEFRRLCKKHGISIVSKRVLWNCKAPVRVQTARFAGDAWDSAVMDVLPKRIVETYNDDIAECRSRHKVVRVTLPELHIELQAGFFFELTVYAYATEQE